MERADRSDIYLDQKLKRTSHWGRDWRIVTRGSTQIGMLGKTDTVPCRERRDRRIAVYEAVVSAWLRCLSPHVEAVLAVGSWDLIM